MPDRPDPDALLLDAAREGRGRLKVFLGSAPGVGKTWEMLNQAQRAKRDGRNVLVGVVETHGRAETSAQIGELPILPRKVVPYRGQTLEEFDVEAAILARPELLLVDELAHTNAPFCRHHKRWEDVKDILDAGINVWATLNVQHLESLNDSVARITGIRVTETLPDHVLELADEIELIDLPPAELRKRVVEGHVYRADIAKRALEGIFREGNLAALREMALRQAAQIVDTNVRDYMRRKAISGPWPAGHRVLALLGTDDSAEQVVRHAKRLSDALRSPWIALHIERPDDADAARPALEMAAQLGATIEIRAGTDIVDAAVAFARERNITHLVLGRARSVWWRKLLRRGFAEALVHAADEFTVLVVPAAGIAAKPAVKRQPGGQGIRPWLISGALLGLVIAAGYAFSPWLEHEALGMMFLAIVVVAASRYGLRVALVTAFLGFLSWDVLFVDPRYQLAVSNPRDLVALVVFLLVASTTGLLASRLRSEVQSAQERIENMRRIQSFGRALSVPGTEPDLMQVVAEQAAAIAGQAVMLLPRQGMLDIAAAAPTALDTLDEGSWAAAQWCFSKSEMTGHGTATLPSSAWRFLPLGTMQEKLGVIGVRSPTPLEHPRLQALAVLADHAATSLQRVRLSTDSARSEAQNETQKLRTALLNSLSHDLRTPLTAIRGAAGALRQAWNQLDDAARNDLLDSIDHDIVRMTRFLANITEMTRLESGEIAPALAAVPVGPVIEAALDRVPDLGPAGVKLDDDLPAALCDAMLLEQVLVNVLENAAKYGPPDGLVRVDGRLVEGEIVISVTDEGSGIATDDLPHIFDSFYRARREDRTIPGTGLGLAIARGLTEAMGGRIWAVSPRPNAARDAAPGTVISIALPRASGTPAP